jgi:hypothetical protein
MVNFEESYILGSKEENRVLPIIKEFFNKDIQRFEDRYSKYDYFDNECVYELKTRFNSHDKYPTTLITMNKLTEDKKLILLFNFRDCLTYIEYDKERFSKYSTKMFSRAKIEGDMKEHIYIDIYDLIIIKTYI